MVLGKCFAALLFRSFGAPYSHDSHSAQGGGWLRSRVATARWAVPSGDSDVLDYGEGSIVLCVPAPLF